MNRAVSFLVVLITTLSLAGCLDSVQTESQMSEYTKTLRNDYHMVSAANGDGAVDFLEVKAVLSDTLTKVEPEELSVVRSIEVFRAGGKIIIVDRDVVNGNFEMTERTGFWADVKPMSIDRLGSLEKALKTLYKSRLNIPKTVYLTIKNPFIGTDEEYPLYIFGNRDEFRVSVDAEKYEVKGYE